MVIVSTALVVVALGAGTASAAPPSVDFGLSPATARVGATVTFTASASGADGATIAALDWSFGDGASGSGVVAGHAYASAGTRTATLTATDSNGETASASHTVRIVGDPVAAFSFSPAVPNIDATVSFDGGGSNDPGGGIASYAWSFGDGATATGQSPSHAYATSGDKAVTLTITAALDGRAGSVTRTVHVNVVPKASFVFAGVNAPAGQDPFTPVLGQQVAFSAQASSDLDGAIASYAWDLGTGSFGGPTAVPWLLTTFPAAGPKVIRLKVTDNGGATATAQTTFRVNTPPVAGFDVAPAAPLTGATVSFTSTASDPDGVADLAATSWDLNGDGTYGDATGPSAKAMFLTAGTYTVGEKVTDKGGAATIATRQLSVSGPPAAPPAETGSDGGTPPTVVPSPGAPVILGFTSGGSGGGSGPSAVAAQSGATSRSRATALLALRGVRVQLAGSVTGARTTITRLTVVGPVGALVVVRCAGAGCPARAVRRHLGSSGRIRIATLRRTLRAGAKVVVSVAKAGYATRRITLTMRAGRAPARAEACLAPGADGGKAKAGACPS
jgi:PKD repeat protein